MGRAANPCELVSPITRTRAEDVPLDLAAGNATLEGGNPMNGGSGRRLIDEAEMSWAMLRQANSFHGAGVEVEGRSKEA